MPYWTQPSFREISECRFIRVGGGYQLRRRISALKGIGGSVTEMQITAPVQPGNSGGPLVGSDGDVVGVVVGKLDALRVAGAVGDIPQNVNFAIQGEIAKLYLSQNGVLPVLSSTDDPLDPVELAEKVSGFTVFVECRGN